jgi:FkbM family methyltransferase
MTGKNRFEKMRCALRDALPLGLGRCLTLRANPLLGLAFLMFRREFRIEGMRFAVPTVDQSWSSLATYWFDDYEKPEREFCARWIRPDDRVCELGGCLGIVSMVINRMLSVPEQHLVLEANPALIPLISANRERNGGRFQILHAAAGDGRPLHFDADQDTLSGRAIQNASKGILVQGRRLSDLWELLGPCTVLVMDIEGAEMAVFSDPDECWRECRLIVVEWHPSLISAEAVELCRAKLGSANFRCVGSRAGSLHIVEAWLKQGKE